jgi:lipopolysaccharide transport system ATP-binding protein
VSKIIEVRGLSKSYIINHEGKEQYTALRDVIARKAKKIFSFPGWKPSSSITKEEFWALKDIDFDIEQGDRVGIIGRNGAGKSTLLKILSRITDPTTGTISIKGRIASLLEVGTGFHPELTGRENVFLNGAILGMSRSEIKKQFDAIVDFAEVERFLDTPVKRYSSGMYVRLAFAVAAHLEPEILIVDEVLAVGDAQFQKKCLGKMEDVSKNEGRTVLFVSHNITALKSICTSCIILQKGEKKFQGNVNESLEKYLNFDNELSSASRKYIREETPSKHVFLKEAELIDVTHEEYFFINLRLKIYSRDSTRLSVNLRLKDELGFPAAYGCSHIFKPELHSMQPGENIVHIKTEKLNLAVGKFRLGIEIVLPGIESLDFVDDCIQFEVSNDTTATYKFGVMQSWGFSATEIKFKEII